MRKTHVKITVCEAYQLGVKEGLIPKEQQNRAAAGSSSSTGQTRGISSSMSFKRQAMLPEGQLHSWEETEALPKEGAEVREVACT